MRQSLMFIPTMRQNPSEPNQMSYNMLLRAGYMRQNAKGIFSYLPLAKRVMSKIEKMIQEKMEQLQAMEILLPTIQSIEHFHKQQYFMFNDRNNKDLFLNHQHKQMMLQLVSEEIHSYKRLPITFYEVHLSYQDIDGPRVGLFSSREFIKKEAYSFHATEESLHEQYEKMYECYTNIFNRLRIHFKTVVSNRDEQENTIVHDFIVLTDSGEETIALSNESEYVENITIAPIHSVMEQSGEIMKDAEKVHTVGVKTIHDVCEFFNVTKSQCIKSLVYKADKEVIVALVRGDHQLSEKKLKRLLQIDYLQLADEQTVKEIINCSPGSIGPMKLPFDVTVIADQAIQFMKNAIAGANEDDYHYINVNPEKDFAVNQYGDIRHIQEGDPSPDGVGQIELKKGAIIGQIEKSRIPQNINASYQDDNGEIKPILMGSYNINITRLFQVIADQNTDDEGFAWSTQLAPFDIHLMAINSNDELQTSLAEQLYNILTSYRFEVLYDDRHERAGVKFNDSDLIGLPVRVIIGKRAEEGMVEVKVRKTGETYECAKEELIDRLNEFFRIN